ncbi:hypothetical protein ADUPG1_008670 [Aduncisulcus paluster]|uniref:Uncharacterized protein n=1 Tax=Aduncisulcus paluster TaxID=2918883 RepID=A0ABQ5KST3_9EUKA|nr:hypothetical protein ADUPG1_008670 [Aduncisulcus paluster]
MHPSTCIFASYVEKQFPINIQGSNSSNPLDDDSGSSGFTDYYEEEDLLTMPQPRLDIPIPEILFDGEKDKKIDKDKDSHLHKDLEDQLLLIDQEYKAVVKQAKKDEESIITQHDEGLKAVEASEHRKAQIAKKKENRYKLSPKRSGSIRDKSKHMDTFSREWIEKQKLEKSISDAQSHISDSKREFLLSIGKIAFKNTLPHRGGEPHSSKDLIDEMKQEVYSWCMF